MDEDLDCKVFIDWSGTLEGLVSHIKEILGTHSGEPFPYTVINAVLWIRVDTNDNRASGADSESKAFLGYQYLLDIEPEGEPSRSDYVEAVRYLLRNLKTLGCDVVAACTFEDALEC